MFSVAFKALDLLSALRLTRCNCTNCFLMALFQLKRTRLFLSREINLKKAFLVPAYYLCIIVIKRKKTNILYICVVKLAL